MALLVLMETISLCFSCQLPVYKVAIIGDNSKNYDIRVDSECYTLVLTFIIRDPSFGCTTGPRRYFNDRFGTDFANGWASLTSLFRKWRYYWYRRSKSSTQPSIARPSTWGLRDCIKTVWTGSTGSTTCADRRGKAKQKTATQHWKLA